MVSVSVAGYGGRLPARHTHLYWVRYRASRYLSADRAHPECVLISRRLLRKSTGPRFIPAEAGTQLAPEARNKMRAPGFARVTVALFLLRFARWIPAFVGMTG